MSPLQSCLRLSVYRNETFVEDYYLKQGAYQVSVETNNKEANFILRYPKCPVSTFIIFSDFL